MGSTLTIGGPIDESEHIHGCGHEIDASVILNDDNVESVAAAYSVWEEKHAAMTDCECFNCWSSD